MKFEERFKLYGILSVIAIIIAIFATIISFKPSLVNLGATAAWNIPLSEGALLIGNSLGYAEEDTTPSITGNTTITGDFEATGYISGDKEVVALAPASVYATTTLVAADSGKVYSLSGKGNTIILPAVSNSGAIFTFIIGAAFDTGNFMITSAAGDDIEGSIIVAGAVVDCDAADAINFIADGENIGDFVTIISNGTKWIPLQSGGLAGSKMTCTG